MIKYYLFMVLCLFFQPLSAQSTWPSEQKTGKGNDPLSITLSTDQIQFSDTVNLELNIPDSISKDTTYAPVDLRNLHQSNIEEYTTTFFPHVQKTFPQNPDINKNLLKHFPKALPPEFNAKQFTVIPENIGKTGNTPISIPKPIQDIRENFNYPDLLPKSPDSFSGIPGLDRLPKTDGLLEGPKGLKNQNPDLFSGEPIRLLPGKIISNSEFDRLDSIRKAVPKAKRLFQKEEKLEEGFKKIAFAKKTKFWDRTYLEGIIGLDPKSSNINNISPAMGYYLNPKFSLGLGPNINLADPKKTVHSAMGARSFFKYELLKRKIYLQAEDLGHLNKGIVPGDEKQGPDKIDHSVFLGAGYLLPVSKTLSLNILMLYNMKGDLRADRHLSPFNLRVGMSSFKALD